MSFLLITFLLAQIRPPPARVSCIATNYPEVLVHKNSDNTATLTDLDDWRVNCKITIREAVIFNEALTLPHPTEYMAAMAAIDDFRKKRALQILKDAKK